MRAIIEETESPGGELLGIEEQADFFIRLSLLDFSDDPVSEKTLVSTIVPTCPMSKSWLIRICEFKVCRRTIENK